MFLGFGNQLSWLLCCGVGITVQYLLNLLCCIIWWLHLSPTRLHQIEHYKKKSAHSDWSITHLLFAHGWMVMKASTCSKPCAPLSDYSMFFLPHGLHTKKVRFLNMIIPPVIILQSRNSKDSFPYRWHICISNVINMCYVQTGYNWQFKISTNYVKPLSPNSSLVFIINLMYQRFKVLLLGTTSVLRVMDNY